MLPRRLSQISSMYGWKGWKRNPTLCKQERGKAENANQETQTRRAVPGRACRQPLPLARAPCSPEESPSRSLTAAGYTRFETQISA